MRSWVEMDSDNFWRHVYLERMKRLLFIYELFNDEMKQIPSGLCEQQSPFFSAASLRPRRHLHSRLRFCVWHLILTSPFLVQNE